MVAILDLQSEQKLYFVKDCTLNRYVWCRVNCFSGFRDILKHFSHIFMLRPVKAAIFDFIVEQKA